MNPVKKALNDTQLPVAPIHQEMSVYSSLREDSFSKAHLLGANGRALDINATLFCNFSSIENTPLYLDAQNLTKGRIQ